MRRVPRAARRREVSTGTSTPQTMALRRVARDGALAAALGAVVGDRVGAPERALARRDDAATTSRDAMTPVVVWCDRASVARGAIDAGDVVALRARDGDGVVIQRVTAVRGAHRGTCALEADARWRGRARDDDGDRGETPVGALRGRIAAVLWPPSAMRIVARGE